MKKPVPKASFKYFVYILRTRIGTLYTGYTNDLEKRIETHNAGTGAKYLRGKGPVKLMYSKRFRTLSAALKEEIRIKTLTRSEKELLINARKRLSQKTFNAI